jgi:hypothetical protein
MPVRAWNSPTSHSDRRHETQVIQEARPELMMIFLTESMLVSMDLLMDATFDCSASWSGFTAWQRRKGPF